MGGQAFRAAKSIGVWNLPYYGVEGVPIRQEVYKVEVSAMYSERRDVRSRSI